MREDERQDSCSDNEHGTDELPTFDPFQTFIVQNIDKSLSPQDLKTLLCPDVERNLFVTVHMPSDKLGNTKGTAVISAPKTYTRNIMEIHGTSSSSQRNKKLVVTKQDYPTPLKATKWVKTEDGTVRSCTEQTGVTAEPVIKLRHCLVDSGAYFCHEKFTSKKDIDKVIERTFLSGIEKIMIKTMSVRQALKAQKLAASYPGILYFTAGVHPSEGGSWNGETTLSKLRDLLADPQCAAVGEIGLDIPKNSKCSIEVQTEIFTAQVSLACEMGKPLIISECKMTDLVLDILDKFKSTLSPVCIGTDNKKPENVHRYLEKGFYISLTGNQWKIIEYPCDMNIWLGNLSKEVYNKRIVLASDAPFHYPSFVSSFSENSKSYFQLVRKSTCTNLTDYCSSLTKKYCSRLRNESVSLQSVAELASGELEMTADRLAAVTRKNAYKFFNFQELDKKLSENPKQNVIQNKEKTQNTNYISSQMLCFVGILPVLFLILYEIVLFIDTLL